MAVISQIMEHTPLAGSGLSIPEANKQRMFARWVEAKEVRNTEFTDWVKRRSNPYEQIDIETGQSYAPFISTTLGAQAGASDEVLTLASTALIRVGDQYKLRQFYGTSTTEYNDTLTERGTVLEVPSSTTVRVQRHEGEVADGSYRVHPSGSVFQVVSRAQNYNEPFPDAITFRGDSRIVHPQRFDSGEVTYDLAAVQVPDFEAPNGHMMRDIMYWKNELPHYRNDAFINGRKVTGNYLATPKIPYRLAGVIWHCEQISANLVPINGLLNLFDFSDVYEDLATNHADGPGDTVWMAPRMRAIWAEMLQPYKGMFGPGDTTMDIRFTRLRTEFGSVDGVKTDNQWPPSKILITSRSDWEWGNFVGMDWQFVDRTSKELGAFQKSWTMGGDFAFVGLNVSHQRLMTGVDTRKELYPARSAYV